MQRITLLFFYSQAFREQAISQTRFQRSRRRGRKPSTQRRRERGGSRRFAEEVSVG
jgi:hypothetical protein